MFCKKFFIFINKHTLWAKKKKCSCQEIIYIQSESHCEKKKCRLIEGPTGPSGIGFTGPTGPCCTGQMGFTGPTGPCCTGQMGFTGPTGPCCTGPTGAPRDSFVGRTLFVDSVYGNDVTGQRENFNLPYLTLEEASTDALIGDLIIVRPGNYSPTGTVSKDGVDWFFQDQTTVIDTLSPGTNIFDSGNYSVTGAGIFLHNINRNFDTFQAREVRNLSISGDVEIEIQRLDRLIMNGGNLTGHVNVMFVSDIVAPLINNISGKIELQIDYIRVRTEVQNLAGIISNNSSISITNLFIGNIEIAGPTSAVVVHDGRVNIVFNELSLDEEEESSGDYPDLFVINAGQLNIIGNLIHIIDNFLNMAVFGPKGGNLSVNVNRIDIGSGQILTIDNTTETGIVTIRGNEHVSRDADLAMYETDSSPNFITTIEVENITASQRVGLFSSGSVYVISPRVISNSDSFQLVGFSVKLVLQGGYQSNNNSIIRVIVGNPTIILRNSTLQVSPTDFTIAASSPIIIQNHGIITANRPLDPNVTLLFPFPNAYNMDPTVVI